MAVGKCVARVISDTNSTLELQVILFPRCLRFRIAPCLRQVFLVALDGNEEFILPIINSFLPINKKILIVEKQKSIFWKARFMGFLKSIITFM